ncbi:MAG: hypothetical protein IJX34_02575 [Clostridia bacterium]|nr:hypothetical protein [Clostridia bacterium]
MGRTYTVPRSAKGESRFLYIFSVKSLITTILGAICGMPIYLVLSLFGMTIPGLISIALMAVIGYFVGVLTIPDSPLFGNLRKAGGEKVSDILIRTATFIKRKKIYIYRMNSIDKKNKKDEENDEEIDEEFNEEVDQEASDEDDTIEKNENIDEEEI